MLWTISSKSSDDVMSQQGYCDANHDDYERPKSIPVHLLHCQLLAWENGRRVQIQDSVSVTLQSKVITGITLG